MNFENGIFSLMHLHYDVDKIKSYVNCQSISKIVCTPPTVWEFQNFSVTQILREIKIGEFETSKIAILLYSEVLNFDFYEFLLFVKAKFDQKIKMQFSKLQKWHLRTSGKWISKNDFT